MMVSSRYAMTEVDMVLLRKNTILLRYIARAMEEEELNVHRILQLPLIKAAGISADQIYNVWENFGGKKRFPKVVLNSQSEASERIPQPLLDERELEVLAQHLRINCLMGPALESLNADGRRNLRRLAVVEFIRDTFGSMDTYRTYYEL